MKTTTKLLILFAFIGGTNIAYSQDQQTLIVGIPDASVYTADVITQTSDGFSLQGRTSKRAATPEELELNTIDVDGGLKAPGCGFWGNWVCGFPRTFPDPNYPGLTWIKCEGTTGKCAKVGR